MSDWKIDITPKGISVKSRKRKEYIDPETNERVSVPLDNHRKSVSIDDYDDAEQYHQAIERLINESLGVDFTTVVSRVAVDNDELNRLRRENANLRRQLRKLIDEQEGQENGNSNGVSPSNTDDNRRRVRDRSNNTDSEG